MARVKPLRKKSRRATPAASYIDDNLFIRFPPELIDMPYKQWQARKFPKLDLITDLKNGVDIWPRIHIRGEERYFRETRDPLALLHAFVASIKANIYPDIGVLRELATRMETFLNAKGKTTLDKALGLKKRGRGSSFSRRDKTFLTQWIAEEMYSLKTGFGLSTEEAAERVAGFLERHQEFGLMYTPETLVDHYSRRWKRQFKLDESDDRNLSNPNNTLEPWDQARRDSFLQSFPSFSV